MQRNTLTSLLAAILFGLAYFSVMTWWVENDPYATGSPDLKRCSNQTAHCEHAAGTALQ